MAKINMSTTGDLCESTAATLFTLKQTVAAAAAKMKIHAEKQTLSDKEIRALGDLIKSVKNIEEIEVMLQRKDFLSKMTDQELLEIAKTHLLPEGKKK